MKKILQKLLACITAAALLLSTVPALSVPASAADTSVTIPADAIHIRNKADLNAFEAMTDWSGKTFVLEYYNDGIPFSSTIAKNPDHPFNGTLIFNTRAITLNCRFGGNSSLFAFIGYAKDATIANAQVQVDWINTPSGTGIGAVVGSAENCRIINCRAGGSIDITHDRVGGIVGKAVNTVIENCTFTGSLQSGSNKNYVGGICGEATGCTVRDCVVMSYQLGSPCAYTGGIVGKATDTTIRNCVSQKTVNVAAKYVGGIAGYVSGGGVYGCTVTGPVTGGDNFVGGLVGYATETWFVDCENTGKVTATGCADVGGIVGCAINTDTRNCDNRGEVSAATAAYGCHAGGIAGQSICGFIDYCMNYANVTGSPNSGKTTAATGGIVGVLGKYDEDGYSLRKVDTCGNRGNITGFGSDVGAFIGRSDRSDLVAYACINTGSVSSVNTTPNKMRYGKDCADAENGRYEDAVNTVNKSKPHRMWGLDASGLPTMRFPGKGTEAAPYVITSTEELKLLAANVNNQSDFSGEYFRLDADVADDGTMEPIGDVGLASRAYFSGHFDGNGHTVYLRMSRASGTCAALFGSAYKAEIHDLRVAGTVSGNAVSGEDASDPAASFEKLHASAGICAKAKDCKIYNCQNDANVQGGVSGGIAGIAVSTQKGAGTVENCANRGQILGMVAAGGIAGAAAGANGNSPEIRLCANTGKPAALYAGKLTEGKTSLANLVALTKGSLTVSNCHYLNNGVAAVGAQITQNGCAGHDAPDALAAALGSAYGSKMEQVENSVGFAVFGHSHVRPEQIYAQVDSGIGYDGHKVYYGCNTCGKLYLDETMTTEVNATTLMLKTTIKAKGESSPVTLLDEDVFFSSDEVKAYLKNNQNRTFSYVSLGFDVETNVPLRFAKDLAVALNGYTWLYSGAEDSSVFAEAPGSEDGRTLTIIGGEEGTPGTIEVFEACTCSLAGKLAYTASVTLENVNVKNTGSTQCGGLFSGGGKEYDSNGVSRHNTLPNVRMSNVNVTGSFAGKNGGAIYLESSDTTYPYHLITIELENTVFENCFAVEYGGAICSSGVPVAINGDGSSRFKGCHSGKRGGAVSAWQGGFASSYDLGEREIYRPGIFRVDFISNYSGETSNFTVAKSKPANSVCGGGAVYSAEYGFNIQDCTFQYNITSGDGGAILIGGTGQAVPSATVDHCNFQSNAAVGLGYEISILYGTLSNLTVQNSRTAFDGEYGYYSQKQTTGSYIIYVNGTYKVNVKDVGFTSGVLGSMIASGKTLFVLVGTGVILLAVAVLVILRKRKPRAKDPEKQ